MIGRINKFSNPLPLKFQYLMKSIYCICQNSTFLLKALHVKVLIYILATPYQHNILCEISFSSRLQLRRTSDPSIHSSSSFPISTLQVLNVTLSCQPVIGCHVWPIRQRNALPHHLYSIHVFAYPVTMETPVTLTLMNAVPLRVGMVETVSTWWTGK